VLLSVVGVSWLAGYLDYILLPSLICFLGLTAYALWRRHAL
jgi:mercuric ion transport protein